jgi:DNA-binding NtrC family response regulator
VNILVITASQPDRQAFERIATKAEWQVRFADTCEQGLECLGDSHFGVILCDRDVPGGDWREHFSVLHAAAPGSCMILVSRVNDDYLWEEVIRSGGYDVLSKPLQETQVVRAVSLAWSYWKQYSAPRLAYASLRARLGKRFNPS